MPWNSSYARTRLPVPNNSAKNRNSSPSTSASSSSPSAHQQLQQVQNQSSTQQGSRGKLQYNSGPTTSGFPNNRNGINNNNHNNSTCSTTSVDKQNQNREASPASISAVCCYSNSLKNTSNKNARNNNLVKVSNKYSDSKKLQIVNNKGERKDILPDNESRVNENRNGFGYNYDYGAVNSAQKRNDSSKLVNREDVPSGSESGLKQNDGDDLNLNFRITQHVKEPRLKDVNLNNFKKNNISCDVYFGLNSSISHTNNKNKSNIRNNTNTIGDYVCGDELSSSSSLSPRSPSPLPLPPPSVTDTWSFRECVKLTPPSSPNPARSGSFDRKVSQRNSTTPQYSVTSYRGFNVSPIDSLQTRSRTFSDSDGCCSTYSEKNNQSYINRTTDNQNKFNNNTDCKQRLDEYFTPSARDTDVKSYRFAEHRENSLPVIDYSQISRIQPYRKLSSDIISTKNDASSSCFVSNQIAPKLPLEGSLLDHVDTDARLQSLNRYCAKNLIPSINTSLAGGTPLDDFNFIDSSDISSTGDDTVAVNNVKEFLGPHKVSFIPKNEEALVNSSGQSDYSCSEKLNSYGRCSAVELSSACSSGEPIPISVTNRSADETKINFYPIKYKKCSVASLTPSVICRGNRQNCSLFPAVSEKTVQASGKSDDNNNQRPRNTCEKPKYSISNNSYEKNDESSGRITSNHNSRNLLYAKNYNTGPEISPSGLNCFTKSQLYARLSPEKSIMEKRNNTLDRLQKLVKKTTSGSHENKTIDKHGCSKTERLRELTELLRGTRAPPVPPPRRLRHLHSIDKSFDRQDTSASTTSLLNIDSLRGADETSNLLNTKESRSIDIPYHFADIQRASTPSSPRSTHKEGLRANASTSNLECLKSPSTKESTVSDSKPELSSKEDEEEFSTKLSRPESRTIVGSYTQKTIPFRSASFSQVDYSSGKYIRSALGAIKNSLMRGKENSVIDNVTLPRNRKEFARSCSPAQLSTSSEPGPSLDDSDVPKLKKTELCINLVPPDSLDGSEAYDAKDMASNRNSDIETIVEDPEAEHIETVENESLHHNNAEINVMQASEMILEPLIEEGIPIKPQLLAKDEECLQQATTCLIPMPVFDCIVSEWSTARPSEQWVDASITECTKDGDFLENDPHNSNTNASDGVIDRPQEVIEPDTAQLERVDELEEHDTEVTQECHKSVTDREDKDVICTPPISIICTEPDSLISTTIIETPPTPEEHSTKLDPADIEIVEVRKRHSNNEEGGEALNSCNSEIEEKRRIDKSKRRKGIYIQWPAIDTNIDPESDSNDNGTSDCSWRPNRLTIEKDSSLDLSGESITDLSSKDIASSPEKTKELDILQQNDPFLLDPNTPDSDIAKPVWPKGSRRKSLTYQSSDEKDDSAPLSSIPVRSFKNLFLRSDSVSDNESERGSSRDRTNVSPAPVCDQDLKRYSKRPLRGPYGQMLEAEMKKPSKVHYNEILEELSKHDASQSFPSFNRNRSSGSQSMDETNDRHSSKLFKPRKASANLLLPSHTRTASSPSKLAELGVPDNTLAGNGKRLLSNIDQRSTDSDKSDKSCKHDIKKLSLDSHISEQTHDKLSSDNHDKNNKRNSSGTNDKHPKRSLDDTRYSKSSRTPSERSFVLNTPDTPKTLVASPELLAELLKGSSEKLVTEQLTDSSSPNNASNALPTAVLKCMDTRTHVAVELFNTEKSYVESLQTIVLKYLNQLKSPENAGLVDTQTVDEIFFMVPALLNIHERFLEELRRRLDAWHPLQQIGDAFVEVFSRSVVVDTYTSYVNNCSHAKDAIRAARQKCPAFARFLETMAREHKGKLSLDNLLIKPVQKFPNYELILGRLIKNTDINHPDQKPLEVAVDIVRNILQVLNCKKQEALENDQRETLLRDLEGVIDGMNDLVSPKRAFLLFDLVSMPTGQATRKERGFFMFNDLLVITSIKRRSGTIRKANLTCPGSVMSTLDTNKYKFLTKIPLDDLEIIKSKDDNVRRIMREIEYLTDDSNKLSQINDLATGLRCPHQLLEDAIKDLQREIQRQLSERQANDAQLSILELTLNSPNGVQNMTVVFSKPEKRTLWEQAFTDAKQKLAKAMERSLIPEFLVSVPIRKTRAGLQFTCASPTLGVQRDVWVCNSDGYVGQVCVLSLTPEPTVTSCNGVCNARILCVASVPAHDDSGNVSKQDPTTSTNSIVNLKSKPVEKISSKTTDDAGHIERSPSNIQLDSDSSSDDSESETQPECTNNASEVNTSTLPVAHRPQGSNSEDADIQQPTMWLGTEDGCIHVYNCTDNIRIKKNKIKIPHISAVCSILYLANRVFVALTNGDICVYCREDNGWNTTEPFTMNMGQPKGTVTKLLDVHGKIWCVWSGCIRVLNPSTMQVDVQIQVSTESTITNITVANEYVWLSLLNLPQVRCYHHESFELIYEVELAASVSKMLSNCDDIIRQHKAACLRVTSLMSCKDLIWVGTSAGVLLTISTTIRSKTTSLPVVTGIPHGHTGHVRFLTFVEAPNNNSTEESTKSTNNAEVTTSNRCPNLLVISGGDGYEDFRSTGNNSLSEIAGREDSTNHLLLWQV